MFASMNPQNTSTKLYFTYFDGAVVCLAIFANLLLLFAVIRSNLGLCGYRRFLISLSAGDLYICIVNLLTLIYQVFSTADQLNNNKFITSPTASSLMASFAMQRTTTAPATVVGGLPKGDGESFLNQFDDPTKHPLFRCSANVLRTLKLAGFFTNLLNLCGMSIDHFIGIMYPMKYRYIMNKHVARLAVVAIWIISFILAFLDIPINVVLYYGTVTGPIQWSGTMMGGKMHNPFQTSTSQTLSANGNDVFSAMVAAAAKNVDIKFTNSFTQPSTDTTRIRRGMNDLRDILNDLEPPSAILIAEIFNATSEDDEEDDYIFRVEKLNTHNTSIDNDAKSSLSRMLSILRDDEERTKDVCTFFSGGKMWFEIMIIVLALLCFVFLAVCYGVIFKNVSRAIPILNTTGHRTRKLIFTTVMFLGAFMLCWLPFMTFEFALLLIIQSDNRVQTEIIETETLFQNFFLVDRFFNSLMMTYPLIDPLIYAARLPAVQRHVLWLGARMTPCLQRSVVYLNERNQQRLMSARPSLRITIRGSETVADEPQNMPMVQSSSASIVTSLSNNSNQSYLRVLPKRKASSPQTSGELILLRPQNGGRRQAYRRRTIVCTYRDENGLHTTNFATT